MTNRFKKLISILCAVSMLFTSLPWTALASDTTPESDIELAEEGKVYSLEVGGTFSKKLKDQKPVTVQLNAKEDASVLFTLTFSKQVDRKSDVTVTFNDAKVNLKQPDKEDQTVYTFRRKVETGHDYLITLSAVKDVRVTLKTEKEENPAPIEPEEETEEESGSEAQPLQEEQPEEQPEADVPPAEQPAEEPAVEEPIAEEPAAEEPAAEEPVAEKPTVEEPVEEQPAEEPVVEEPAAEEPVAEEPAVEVPAEQPAEEPVAEEPIAEEVEEQPVEEPAAEEPAEEPAEESVAEEPIVEEAEEQQPAEEPTAEEPAEQPAEEPVVEEPIAEEVEQQPAEEPAAEEPAEEPAEESVAEEPIFEEVEEQPAEEPAAEEPAEEPVEEPIAEEPIVEETEEQPAEEPAAEELAEEPVEEPIAEEPIVEEVEEQQPAEEPAAEDPAEQPVQEETSETVEEQEPEASEPQEETEGEQTGFYSGTLVVEGKDYTVTAIIGEDAEFPKDICMLVREILPGTDEYALYSGLTDEQLDDWEEQGEFARFFDITFVSGEGDEATELEPAAFIDVQITFHEAISVEENIELEAVHFKEETPEVLTVDTDSVDAALSDPEAVDTVTFSSDSFSVYGVFQKKTIVTKTIQANGQSYTIEVSYDKEAGFPEDPELRVTEITEDHPDYAIYRAQAEAALSVQEAHLVSLPGLYDISIYNRETGEKADNPDKQVTVTIRQDSGVENDGMKIVHFTDGIEAAREGHEEAQSFTTEESAPVLEEPLVDTQIIIPEVEGDTVTFATEGFSVYALAFTVDYTYEDHEYHMQGETSMLLSELFTKLNIAADARNATKVEFTDPTLLSVEKIEDDWQLTSLKPFTSEETLTVTMNDGTVYRIEVWDEQAGLSSFANCSVAVVSGSSTTDISRNASIGFNLSFTVPDNNISTAKNNTPWVYDFSSLISTDEMTRQLAAIAEVNRGNLWAPDGITSRGWYEIHNNQVILHPDEAWLSGVQTDLAGSFFFTAELDEQYNKDKTSDTLSFGGSGEILVKYETISVQSEKKVGSLETDVQTANDGRNIQVRQNSDGSYTLCYEVNVTPDTDITELKFSESFSANQTLVQNSAELYRNGEKVDSFQISATVNGFSGNLGKVEKDNTYTIKYQTTISAAELNKEQTNSITWDWNTGTKTDETKITPTFDTKLESKKSVGLSAGDYIIDQNGEYWGPTIELSSVNADGTVTLYYETEVTPNKDLTELSLTDVFGSGNGETGQILTSTNCEFYINGEKQSNNITVVENDDKNGFTANIAGYLTGNNKSVSANTTYKIRYSTTVPADKLGTFQTNKVTYTSGSANSESSTGVTLKYSSGIHASKYAGTIDYIGATSGEIILKDPVDGKYTINYRLDVQPDQDMTSLSVTDVIKNDQLYVSGSLKYNGEAVNVAVNTDSDGNTVLSFDAAVAAGGKLIAGTKYSFTYETTITEDQLGTIKNNDSTWTDKNGHTEHSNTGVTPVKDYKVTKTAKVLDEDAHEKTYHPGDVITYTITYGLANDGSYFNLAGHTIGDKMKNMGVLVGDIVVKKPDNSEPITLTSSGELTGQSEKWVDVFNYTFPESGNFMGPYTVTYQIRLSAHDDWLFTKELNNTARDNQREGYEKVYVEYPGADIQKNISEWDEENNTVYWTILVSVEEGKTLDDVNVVESDFWYASNNWGGDQKALQIDWQGITVKCANSSDSDVPAYTKNRSNNTIHFDTLNKSVVITVPTISTAEFTEYAEFWVYNKATLRIGDFDKPAFDKGKYVNTKISLSKDGTLSSENIATWNVVINRSFIEVDPDYVPWFIDTIPDGMELVDNSISVKVYGQDNPYWNWTVSGIPNNQVTSGSNQIKINLGTLNGKSEDNYDYTINKRRFDITYQTRITESRLSLIGQDASYSIFTNNAEIQKPDGTKIEGDSSTVEYEYDNLIDKTDITEIERTKTGAEAITESQLAYKIEVNPESIKLNNGKMIHLSDRIPTSMTIVPSSIKVVDENGHTIENAIIGYNDDTRILSVYIPDQTHAFVTFIANGTAVGTNQEFTNTVLLKGVIEAEDTVTEKHNITNADGSLIGGKGQISLHKRDEYNLTKSLSGAEFEFYECLLDEKGKITGREKIGNTWETNNEGSVTFTPVKITTTGEKHLYYWIETKAPDGYLIGSNVPHYFVTFDQSISGSQDAAKALDHATQEANGIIVATVIDGYIWQFSNLKDTEAKAVLRVEKTMLGRAMEENEFTFVLKDSDGTILQSIKNHATAAGVKDEISFAAMTYLEEGTYTYTIVERASRQDSNDDPIEDEDIVYDRKIYTVTVAVSRNDDGELTEPTITYQSSKNNTSSDSAVFVNKANGVTSITITKIWDDKNNKDKVRPTADAFKDSVILFQNGTDVTPVYTENLTVTDNGDNTYTVSYGNLPETVNGQDAIYTIKETSVSNYDQDSSSSSKTAGVADGDSITNIHVTNVDVEATKVWIDNSNAYGTRSNITLVLSGSYEDGEGNTHLVTISDPETVIAGSATGDGLKAKWTGLPEYSNGYKVHYTVTEKGVSNGKINVNGAEYTSEVKSDAENGYTVTNTLTGQITFSGKKTWVDNSNQFGLRPSDLEIKLYQVDGTEKKEVVLQTTDENAANYLKWDKTTDSDNWTYKITNLDKYDDNGKLLVYRVKETVPVNYNATSTESAGTVGTDGNVTGADFTNTIETGNLKLTKTVTTDSLSSEKTYQFTVTRKVGETTLYYDIGEAGKIQQGSADERIVSISVSASTKAGTIPLYGLPIGNYTVTEIQSNTAIDYYTLTVTGEGTATISNGQTAEKEIINKYKKHAELKLQGMKYLDGIASSETFTFKVSDETNYPSGTLDDEKAVLPSSTIVSNDIDGIFNIETIRFAKEGTYSFRIREINKTNDSIEYDNTEIVLTVVVGSNTDLSAPAFVITSVKSGSTTYSKSGEYYQIYTSERPTFSNKTKKGTLVIKKEVNGVVPDSVSDTFTFTLTKTDGNDHGTYNKDGQRVDDATISVSSSSSEGTIVNNLPLGTYTLTETNVAPGVGYRLSTSMVGVDASSTNKITFSATEELNKVVTVNNTYTKIGEASLTLKGIKYLDGTASVQPFTFRLSNKTEGANAANVTVPSGDVQNDAGGNFTISGISFKAAGTYTLELKEIAGANQDYIYDTQAYSLSVVVKDNGTANNYVIDSVTVNPGTATRQGNDSTNDVYLIKAKDKEYTFENTTKKGALTIHKIVSNGITEPSTFTFTLKDEKGKTYNENGTQADNATISVSADTYKTISGLSLGTYTLEEVASNAQKDGYTLSTSYAIVDGANTNVVTFTGANIVGQIGNMTINVTNTYTRFDNASIVLSGIKTMEGKELEGNDFEFTLTPKTTNPADNLNQEQIVKNTSDGKVIFTALRYEKTGTFEYEIKETSSGGNGITVDPRIYTVTVEVTAGNGKYVASIQKVEVQAKEGEAKTTVTNNAIVFANTYTTTPVTVPLTAQKTLEGDDLSNHTFEFELKPLTPGDTNQTQIKSNDNGGLITFNSLTFTKKGIYEYQVTEKTESGNGLTKDSSAYTVTITVEDDGKGQLTAAKKIKKGTESVSSISFKNTYNSGSTTATVEASKTLQNKTLENGMFTFSLTPLTKGDPNVAQSITNSGNLVRFADLTYTEIGIYEYKLKEETSSTTSMIADNTEYLVRVEVKDNHDSTKSASVTYLKNGVLVSKADFENTYHPGDLKLKKVVIGNKVTDTEKKASFKFRITVREGTIPVTGTYSVTGISGTESITFNENGVAEISLKHEQEATIVGLPDQASFSITEDGKEGYVTSWNKEQSSGSVSINGTTASGIISGTGTNAVHLVCENRHDTTGKMSITKKLEGNAFNAREPFAIRVEVWTASDKATHIPNGIYGGATFTDGVANLTIGQNGAVSIDQLPYGAYFEVTEANSETYYASASTTNAKTVNGVQTIVEAGNDGKSVKVSGVITDDYKDNKILVIAITNRKDLYGGFSLEKTVIGSDGNTYSTQKEFRFTITLSDKTITGWYGDIYFNEGIADATLKQNDKVYALGLANGITYTILEDNYTTDGYNVIPAITGTIVGFSETESAVTKNSTLDNSNILTVQNTYNLKGRLSVTKYVDGNMADEIITANTKFHITVTLDDNTINTNQTNQYGQMTFVNGVATFDLKNGETISASNLPDGIRYTITEAEYGSVYDDSEKEIVSHRLTGFSASYLINNTETINTGILNARGNNNVVISNTKNMYGGMIIEKVTAGSDPDEKTWFAVDITFSGKTVPDGTYGDVLVQNGKVVGMCGTYAELFGAETAKKIDVVNRVIVTKDRPVVITGLPAGVHYDVIEDSYTGTYDSQDANGTNSGTIAAISSTREQVTKEVIDSANKVTWTNTRNRYGKLVIQKKIEGDEYDQTQLFSFTIFMQKGDETPVTGTYDGVTFTAEGTSAFGKAEISIPGNDSKIITGLPLHASFVVIETPADGFLPPEYQLSYMEPVRDESGKQVKIVDENGKTVNLKVERSFSGTVSDDGLSISWVDAADGTKPVAILESDQRIVTVTNKTTEVMVSKVDFADETVSLAGAEFAIYEVDGTVPVRTWTSTADVKAISGLKIDTEYRLVEIKAPNGYRKRIPEEGIWFRIKNDGTVKVLTELTDLDAEQLSDGTIQVKNRKNYQPQIEKYVNQDVHADLEAFDKVYTYDIIAYVTEDADRVEIYDTLVPAIKFSSTAAQVVTIDLGTSVDHKVKGSVNGEGTAVVGAVATIDGKKLTVTIADASALRGHYVKVTFQAVLDNDVVGDLSQYTANAGTINENGIVLEGVMPHTGIPNKAAYRIQVNNRWDYKLESNTVTVTPPTTKLEFNKAWKNPDGGTLTWPEGATIEVQLQKKNGTADAEDVTDQKVILSASQMSGAFENLPVYENMVYCIREKVTGINTAEYAGTIEYLAIQGGVSATITNKKIGIPSFEKKIQDINDSDGLGYSQWQDSADYDIGDLVPYKLTAVLPEDVTDYYRYHITFEDELEDTLKFNEITKVVIIDKDHPNQPKEISEGSINTKTFNDTAYVFKKSSDQKFTVKLAWDGGKDGNKFAKINDVLLNGATVEVYFNAELLPGAHLGKDGNINTARLIYSNNPNLVKAGDSDQDKDEDGNKPSDEETPTPDDVVIAFTYLVEISKTDVSGAALAGAEFTLEKLHKDENGEESRKTVAKDLTLSSASTFVFKGLDDGRYRLKETRVPGGYKGADPIEFTVTAAHIADWNVTNDSTRMSVLTGLSAGDLDTGVITLTKQDDDTDTLVGDVVNKPVDMPQFEKKIQDVNDSTGEVTTGKTEAGKTTEWIDSADYDIGDMVPYKLTAVLPSDVTDYYRYHITFEDELEDTLRFHELQKVVITATDGTTRTLNAGTVNNRTFNDTAYVFEKTSDQKFTVKLAWDGGKTADDKQFERIKDTMLNGATVEVYFNAELLPGANLGSKGNINTARLRYSNNPNLVKAGTSDEDQDEDGNKPSDEETPTPDDVVIAFTYKVEISKVDEIGNALKGAGFKLEKIDTTGAVIGEPYAVTISGNTFTFIGLDDGIYRLTETVVPSGYKAIDPIEFTVTADHDVVWNVAEDSTRLMVLNTLKGTQTEAQKLTGELVLSGIDSLEGTIENTPAEKPTFEKKIQDTNDTTGGVTEWQDSADYDIGDSVPYRLTAVLADNVTDYYKYHITFRDRMEKGLTFEKIDSVKVNGKALDEDGYTLTASEHGFALTLTWEGTKNNDGKYTGKISDASLNKAKVEVLFTAVLNEKAVLGQKGNVNFCALSYSTNPNLDENGVPEDDKPENEEETPEDFVIAFTYKIDVSKIDPKGEALSGAEFALEKYVKQADGSLAWIVMDDCVKVFTDTTFSFRGLDDGVYRLVETKAPKGYLTIRPVMFTVAADHAEGWTDLGDRTEILESLEGTYGGNDLVTGNVLQHRLDISADYATLSGSVVNKPVETPTFEKKIQDTNDTTGKTSGWQDSADYDIWDSVPYRLTAVLANNVTEYTQYHITFHDVMEKGLTFEGITLVTVNGNGLNADDYDLTSMLTS